jgi:creatinine amidohydrolase
LEELTWPQLEALDRARTVVFVPISPVEEHGPHLPLGTDMYTCRALITALALRLEERNPDVATVLAPLVPIGSSTVPYLGSIGSPPRLVREVLLRMGRAFARDGFRYIVAVSGHMGLSHLLSMEQAARAVSRRYGVHMIAPVAVVWRGALRDAALLEQCAALPEPITGKTLDILLKGHHAGALETSLMLHLHPDLVQPEYQHLRRIRPAQLVRWRGWTRERWAGYMGAPALARADFGQVFLATVATLGADLVARMVKSTGPISDEVFPLTREVGRIALRGSLLLGVLSTAGGLAGFWLRVQRRGKSLRLKGIEQPGEE